MLYGLMYIDYGALDMRLNHSSAVTAETGNSWLITAGTLGIYVASVLSVLIACFGVPRWRFGGRALSWCFLLMGASLLTRLEQCWWMRQIEWHIQVPCYISTACFALPPFIVFAFLRHPVVQVQLERQS